jgi:hypothetical protein
MFLKINAIFQGFGNPIFYVFNLTATILFIKIVFHIIIIYYYYDYTIFKIVVLQRCIWEIIQIYILFKIHLIIKQLLF